MNELQVHEKDIQIVVACTIMGGIGKDGKIPWHFPEDFKRFKDITTGNIVVMGRRSYEEIAEMVKARKGSLEGISDILPNRTTIVLSNSEDFIPIGAYKRKSLPEVRREYAKDERQMFVVGGAGLITEALSSASKVFLTIIKGNYETDRHIPIGYIHENFDFESGEKLEKMFFINYVRK